MSLRYRLAIAFLTVLAPLFLLGVYDLRRDDAERRDSVLQERLVTAQALAALVDASFDRAIDLAELLAEDPTVKTLDPTRLDPYLARYRPVYPEYDSVNVWDAAGINVGASASQPAGRARPSIADREHFIRAMASGAPTVSGVIQARTTNRPAISVTAVIEGPTGKPAGAVTVLVDLASLPERFEHVHVSADQGILVADQSGMIAIDTRRPELSWEERAGSGYGPLSTALNSGAFTGVAEDISHKQPQVIALARSAKYGWVAGLITPETTALGPIRNRLVQQAAVATLVLLVAGLLAITFTKSVTRPLRQLTGAINDFGRGNMSRRAHVETGDELGAAAMTFNQMAEALQTQRERLEFFAQIGADLSSSLLLDRIAEILADKTVSVMGDLSFACLLSEDGKTCRILESRAAPNGHRAAPNGLPMADYAGLVKDTLLPISLRGESLCIPDLGRGDLDDASRGLLTAAGVTSVISVPLRSRGKTIGIIAAMGLNKGRRLGTEELSLAHGIAEIGGVAVENGLLFEELERERSSLDAVIDRMAEGMTIADGSGRIVQLNRRAAEILGVEPIGEGSLGLEEHLSQIDLRYPDGRTVPFDQRPIARAIRGEVFSGVEGYVMRKDGAITHLLFSSGVVKDETGVRLAMTIYMDITPIREMERAREEFISVVAHDLRSPITSIMGYAGILQALPADLRGSPRERKAIESILLGSKRLERMVADLLDASRIEARRLTVAKESIDLVGFVQDVIERTQEQTSGHAVRFRAGSGVGAVQADPARLEQILGNLLSNAAKYSTPGSEIVVEIEPRQGETVVSVVNEGEGVPPAEREDIFTRFYRTRSARGSRTAGLGLGLYITRGLVEAHGGRIWIEGETDRMVAFRFALPIESTT